MFIYKKKEETPPICARTKMITLTRRCVCSKENEGKVLLQPVLLLLCVFPKWN